MTRETDIELGAGHSVELVREKTGNEYLIHRHVAPEGDPCSATYLVAGSPGDVPGNRGPRVDIEQRHPLTLDRPLGCAHCGTVGWIIEGTWSDGGRRRMLRRHPPTAWSAAGGHTTMATARPSASHQSADPDRFTTDWIRPEA